jgi:hypothetical protein
MDKGNLDFVNNCILGNLFFILNRAREQNEKNWLGKMSFENLHPNSNLPKPKEGIFSRLRL